MKKIFIFLVFFLSIFFLPKQNALAVTCSGTVKDSLSGNAIATATVTITSGTTSPLVFTTVTDASGNYSFTLNAVFGPGPLDINKVSFAKTGYQTLTVDTATTLSCPGNVTLQTTPTANQPGFKCDLNSACVSVESNAEYSTRDACTSDCKQLIYNAERNTCAWPDTQYHRQSVECAKVAVTNPSSTCNVVGGCDPYGEYNLECNDDSCDTAIGSINTGAESFIKSLFGVMLSIVGGIALLLIIISGYRLITSQGNPEQVKGAQEQLTAAIVGLLFVIFSLVILETIGVDILGLPGVFGR